MVFPWIYLAYLPGYCPKTHECFFVSGICRSSRPEVLLGKSVLKICSKFTGEHPCRSAISIKLESNFIEITLRHGCPPINLLHIFRTLFLKNTFGCWFWIWYSEIWDIQKFIKFNKLFTKHLIWLIWFRFGRIYIV